MCRTTNGRLKRNRRVNVNRTGYRPVCECAIGEAGTQVWIEGYGLVRVFQIVTPNGDAAQGAPEYWATNDGGIDEMRWHG